MASGEQRAALLLAGCVMMRQPARDKAMVRNGNPDRQAAWSTLVYDVVHVCDRQTASQKYDSTSPTCNNKF